MLFCLCFMQSYLALGSLYVVDLTTAGGLAVVVLLTSAAAVVAGGLRAGGAGQEPS